MESDQLRKQRIFFNHLKHQYRRERILHSPLHTQLEIAEILGRLKRPGAGPVADFGAGSGRVTIPLLQKGYTVYAIDVSEKSLNSLRSIAQKLKCCSFFTAHTFPSGRQFAAIVGADILHHVNLDETLPRIYDALLPRGRAVFSEPCAFNIAWYIYLSFFSDWSVEKGILHCRYFHLIRKFKTHGFRTVSIHGFGFLPTPLFNWSKKLCVFNNRLGDLPILKLFAYRFIIEAIK